MVAGRPRRGRVPWAMTGILVAAFAVRLIVVLVAADGPVCCDAPDYLRHGKSIAAGEWYPPSELVADGGPTVLRPPVYPYFLGSIMAISGDSLKAVRVAQAVVGTSLVGLLGILAWQVFGSRRTAAVTAALAAGYPALVLQSTAYLSEALFLPLEIAALCAAWQSRVTASSRTAWIAGAGVLVGLATLTRQTGMLLAVPVGLMLLTSPGDPLRVRVRHVLTVGVLSLVVVAPWTVRNYMATDHLVLVGRQTGLQLAGVYNEDSRTDSVDPAIWIPPSTTGRDAELFERPGLSELELDSELRRRAIRHAQDHPAYVVESVVRNGLRMLDLDRSSAHLGALSLNVTPGKARLIRWGWFAAAVLAVVGWLTGRRRRVPLWFWLSPLVFFVAGASTAGLLRYRMPIDPFVLLLAASGLVAVVDRVSERTSAMRAQNGPAKRRS